MSDASSRVGLSWARHHELPRGKAVMVVALSAVGLGVLTVLQPAAAAAISAAVLLGALLSSRGLLAPPVDLSGKRFRWVGFAWAFVLLEPIGRYTGGRSALTAAAGIPSAEIVIGLCIHGAISAAALVSLKRNGLGRRLPLLVLALPALALLSAAWSLAPTVTLGFAFDLMASVLLAALTAGITRADRELGVSIVCRALRLTVLGVALLCVFGLLDRTWWKLSLDEPSRFTWVGVFPLTAGAEVGGALLALVFAKRRELGFSWPLKAALLALFAICLYLARARSVWAGIIVAALFGCWWVSKGSGGLRRVAGAAAIGAAMLVLVASFGGPITRYLYRGESQQTVLSLNGRFGLWSFGLQQVHGPGRWLVGYGLNGDRVLFASSIADAWAADAHSAWLELLLSLGLLGVAVALVLIALLAVRLLRAPPGGALPSRVLPILFVYVLAMSPLDSGFAAPGPEPGLGFAVLALCYAAAAASERVPARTAVGEAPRATRALEPAPV